MKLSNQLILIFYLLLINTNTHVCFVYFCFVLGIFLSAPFQGKVPLKVENISGSSLSPFRKAAFPKVDSMGTLWMLLKKMGFLCQTSL